MLLPRRKRENEPPIPIGIRSLAGEASRHLANVFFLSSDDAAERAAIADRNTERLRLKRDNIGLDRRLDDAQRERLGD